MNKCEICRKEISETATTCSPKCRQKLYRRRKSSSVTQRNVTAEIALSEASRDELVTMIELLKKQIEIQQKMLDYFLSSGIGIVQADAPKVPFPQPLIIDDDLMSAVKVTAATDAPKNAGLNFLNSMMAVKG